MAINEQTRAELNYEWLAKYSNGTELSQFDSDEHTFGDVDTSKLTEFSVIKRDGSKSISVNLKTGMFYIDGKEVSSLEDNGTIRELGKKLPEGVVVKPIYFRRVVRVLNSEVIGLANIFHFIGWQGKINDKFEKHEIGISNKTDEIILPPKETFKLL